ncbi:hypothetical protein EMIHUDRAFT_206952 [Emiliania huxleyi CCMP1516]|uniref:K Homology domain-containing protein n=2 Tax=Emiliania huxleyi TaxID=2903 RepID=A0A0D3JKB3_EMIH1|nr:hypothetical protein EMIHUDRAFT_206952 [Emiliania huxleyi CCMP1516]EOD23948.1 hypothetical protein EMIHUDRAFT_206952 [Emiliania huxleyi CCMP1516]|eukprot:XP_005776377.1 hypothetical protein EMIHUDRAFT_206952 [Emiliania huxleyi CCMP1516]
MSNMHAGTVIGKGGGSVKQMREQSGCKVQIAEQVAGEMERLVSITGAASQVTHASELLVDAAPTEPPSHALKLLLSNNQVGGIIGKKGSTIMQMREESGAMIKVEAAATLTNERVVLVNGVRQALVGRLIGRGGAGIKELREASGATIKIESECVPGTDQRRLIISGTPQQTQVAHSLVQTRLAMGP